MRQTPRFFGRLVVLVDEETHAGAEFLAAALQDGQRRVIVGRKTAGRGDVDTVYPLPDGSALQITTASWLTPGGAAIQGRGVQPDQMLAAGNSKAELEAAVGLLRRLVAEPRSSKGTARPRLNPGAAP